jgi:hypothetical protein
MKLSQVVALVKDRKENAKNLLTEAYKTAQKRDSFDGLTRTFRPLLEGEASVPTESKRAANSVTALLESIRQPLQVALDTVLTQDVGNKAASADVNVNVGDLRLTLSNVPATHLLFLEKQLGDLHTFVKALPTLDPNVEWVQDNATGNWRSVPSKTLRTRKVSKSVVLLAPTKEHPGQAQLVNEDIPVIEVETVTSTGAIPEARKAEILRRITAFKEAVVQARETANAQDVVQQREGEQIFDFIFGE